MAEAPKADLADFFKAQGRKKKTKKAVQAESKPDETAAPAADPKQTQAQKQEAATDSKQASKATTNFVDSDEEADADVVLDSSQQSKLTDIKDSQAAKNKKEAQQLQDQGWTANKIFGGKETKEEPKPAAAAEKPQKKQDASSINFGGKPPTFTGKRQDKGIIDKQSFPEFGEVGNAKNDKGVLKKDMGYADSGSSAAASQPKKFGGDSMPIFKGKLKIDSGETADNIQKSKQNYDMSILKMSTASSKPSGGQGGQGRDRGRGNKNFGNNADDDDFEEVTEKKRGGNRKYNNYQGDGSMSFGDSKPSF